MNRKSYLYSKEFQITYEEIVSKSNLFEKFYEIHNDGHEKMIVLPNGRIDIQCIWKAGVMSVYLTRNVNNSQCSVMSDFDLCFGARLTPGLMPVQLKKVKNMTENHHIRIDDFLDMRQLFYIQSNMNIEQKAEIIQSIFARKEIDLENKIIYEITEQIERVHGNTAVGDLITSSGYSHRNINYLFKHYMGCTMKTYANIVRFQTSLNYLLHKKGDAIYADLGYYDQAHLIKEYKKIMQITPRYIQENMNNLAMY